VSVGDARRDEAVQPGMKVRADGFESRVHGGLRIFTFISQFVTNDIIL